MSGCSAACPRKGDTILSVASQASNALPHADPHISKLEDLLAEWLQELALRPGAIGEDEASWWGACVEGGDALFSSCCKSENRNIWAAAWTGIATQLLKACSWTGAALAFADAP